LLPLLIFEPCSGFACFNERKNEKIVVSLVKVDFECVSGKTQVSPLETTVLEDLQVL
jgi:hypothetical protein